MTYAAGIASPEQNAASMRWQVGESLAQALPKAHRAPAPENTNG